MTKKKKPSSVAIKAFKDAILAVCKIHELTLEPCYFAYDEYESEHCIGITSNKFGHHYIESAIYHD